MGKETGKEKEICGREDGKRDGKRGGERDGERHGERWGRDRERRGKIEG